MALSGVRAGDLKMTKPAALNASEKATRTGYWGATSTLADEKRNFRKRLASRLAGTGDLSTGDLSKLFSLRVFWYNETGRSERI
jgi:hypothetical protein